MSSKRTPLLLLGEDDIMRRLEKEWFRFFRMQRGVSLIETVVAVGILGLIGVAFLSGLTTISGAVMMNQENVTVESLAKSQMERIKAQDYIPVDKYGDKSTPPKYYRPITIPADLVSQYDIEIMTPEFPPPPLDVGVGPFEVQSITVVIKRNGKAVFTMSMYREGSST